MGPAADSDRGGDSVRGVISRGGTAEDADRVHGGAIRGGLAIGIASLLAPLYIAEVAPAAIRGRLVALNQMAIVTGILLAYLSNWVLSFLGAESWRWMFLTAAVPSIGFFWGCSSFQRARGGWWNAGGKRKRWTF